MNIALCDDKHALREVLEAMIHVYGADNNIRFHIFHFDSGEKLLEHSLENKIPFHLIFLDQYMKELTGVETALRIREYDTRCHIVFCTASELDNQFISSSPLKIIYKPTKLEDIYAILDNVLAKNQAQRMV